MGAMLGGQRREASVLMEDGLRRSGGRGGADPLGSREPRDGQGKALGQALPLPGHVPHLGSLHTIMNGVLGFPSRRGLTPRGSLECNPEIPAFPGEEY